MEGNTIIGMAAGFIALAIMLQIGTLILGGNITDCTTIRDYVAGADDAGVTQDHNQTGWAAQCFNGQGQTQQGYGLMMISIVVMAAAVVLIVIRLLTG